MSRATIILRSSAERARACNLIAKAPHGTRVDFKASKRTLPQNSKMWSMLSEIAAQLTWHGQKLRPDDFKLIFLDALKRELRVAPNLDGTGFVNLGRSSSDLTKDEMSQMIELIASFGAEHGVVFQDDREAAA